MSLSYYHLYFFFFYPIRAPQCLRKSKAFVTSFPSCFFLLSCCAGMGNWEGSWFLFLLFLLILFSFFFFLWTNSSRGLGKWEGTEGEGEYKQGTTCNLFYLSFFILFLRSWNTNVLETEQQGWLLHSLGWLGFLSGWRTAGWAQWLNVSGCHWLPPVQSYRWATVERARRLQMEVLGS